MKRMLQIIEEALMISTGILVAIGIDGVIAYFQGWSENFILEWYTPLAIVFTGIACALISQILPMGMDVSKANARVRIVIHFLLTFAAVSGIGYVVHWYTDPDGFLYLAISFVIIYVAVWVFMFAIYRHEVKLMNEALKQLRDEE
ncbi:MAG: DUF3021 family protein [Lachnospiraceae bacterium]|nr:DUF3021 family protein [Lachnospiraceae bacterium]MDD6504240.1 DUF3021 family protein [Lachnospiraceae bacterium]